MEKSKQSYLHELVRWGDETKNTLKNSSTSEDVCDYWSNELESWQREVKAFINTEGNEEGFLLLRNDGQQLYNQIKNVINSRQQNNSVGYGQHKLPPLPYDYSALEPYISKEIMELHHNVHHQAYVDGLNKAEKALYDAKNNKEMKHWLREQAFNGSGHNLHTIFWYNMTPNSGKKPIGEIAKRINQDFGSWRSFKDMFTKAAASVEGVGWAVLAWNPRSGRLVIQTFEKHQQFQYADIIPLLVLDVWEHAYYLQYKTDRNAYITNWWNVVNWKDVNNRYVEAKKIIWPLY
ncbi:superoxide dismutase [Virgibacillus oceani]|uniref:superoxide dismutase n=1 Tax=Virgibacillus oceani TaxID=1479511 RepID=A0A917H1B1_9BACI|nr:superoxide dismutase [Virgibacillus oceani]GGG64391.1 putative superoxide dismutase [Fe] [Virgibacillus oceani]